MPHQLLDADDLLRAALKRHLEDPLLRLIQEAPDVLRGLVRRVDDLRACFDQPAPQRLFLHDPRVVFDVCGGRDDPEQLPEVVGAAGALEVAHLDELVAEHHGVHHVAALHDARHGPEQPTVPLAIEPALVQELDRLERGVLIQQHGAQHRLLRFLGPRRLTAGVQRIRNAGR